MINDPLSLEATLSGLQATPLDEAFLNRLEAAAEESLVHLSREEIRFEEFLREIKPAKLTPEFMAQLEKIVHEVPFAVDEKIVLFPRANCSPAARRSQRMWAAAAAVAFVGGLTALMIPSHQSSQQIASRTPVGAPQSTSPKTENFVPASFNRGISEVRDEGIVWKANKQPHSVVRMVYKDLITFKDKTGRTCQFEKPRVEYILVPANTD